MTSLCTQKHVDPVRTAVVQFLHGSSGFWEIKVIKQLGLDKNGRPAANDRCQLEKLSGICFGLLLHNVLVLAPGSMAYKAALVEECTLTLIALQGFNPMVLLQVLLQAGRVGEIFSTFCTFVRPFLCMRSLVTCEVALLNELLVTDFASKN